MGFCRRCGDIVFGPRCKCGGSAVAPVVNWSVGDDGSKQDRWSKTYVTRQDTDSNVVQPSYTGSSNASRRFPRPPSTGNAMPVSLNSQVSAHIRSATSSRPISPLKYSDTGIGSQSAEAKAEEGILPNPYSSELAKVYGSVLQPKDTLSSFACAICSTPFPPDATIYPDPSNVNTSGIDTSHNQDGTRFLCRPCFVDNGGSRGNCDRCHRPVLILKSEGGFVENSGRVWHKKCFECDGCGKNIGDHPMVDLLGKPSCTDCFDSCLKRPARDQVCRSPSMGVDPAINNLGGSRKESKSGEQEGSPALDELEVRLGISRSPPSSSSTATSRTSFTTPTKDVARNWQSSPAFGDRPRSNSELSSSYYSSPTASSSQIDSFRASDSSISTRSPYRRSRTSGVRDDSVGSPTRINRTSIGGSTNPPPEEAIEEMKRRFLSGNASPAISPQKPSGSTDSTARRRSRSRSRPRSSTGGIASTVGTSTPKREKENVVSTTDSPTRPLRSSVSTSSLRLRYQRTGETTTDLSTETDAGLDSEPDTYRILPDRTGESTQPLRIRRNNTGTTATSLIRDITGSTNFVSEQGTGETEYVTANETEYVTANETGGTYRAVESQHTGDAVKSHRTGERIARQQTGEGRIRRQRTGDSGLQAHVPGAVDNTPLSKPRAGDSHVRRQRTGDTDFATVRRRDYAGGSASNEFSLHRDRTGDAEVESLLGPIGSMLTGDLIDLTPLPEATTILSRTPRTADSRIPTRSRDYRASLELGFRTSSSSTSSVASSGYESSASSIPDLASDFSDTTSTRSGGPSTPPSVSPPSRTTTKTSESYRYGSSARNTTPTPRSRAKSFGHGLGISTSDLARDERCAKCMMPLFSVKHGGKFVTVPEEPTSTGAVPKRYHTACFKCTVCGEVFEEKEGGHAVFVRIDEGACHVHCAPPEKITLRKNAASAIPKASKIPLTSTSTGNSIPPAAARTTAYYTSSSRYEPPPTTAHPTGTISAPQPRFGGSSTCPGCAKAVSPMERGVVPGPQGSKWHAGCLICGGLQAKGKRKETGKAGCSKKLDSGAKVDAEGGVWCRECLLLLPPHLRQAAPLRSPIAPASTGSRPFSMIAPQSTGTTLARQFTGFGGTGGDEDVLRQLTGGGLSPTRQLSSSPTKMYDGPRPGVGRQPRPKSVIGTRSTGSGEGRGMFLVRQLTGGSNSFSGNEFGL